MAVYSAKVKLSVHTVPFKRIEHAKATPQGYNYGAIA